MPTVDELRNHLGELRNWYFAASTERRYKVAISRLQGPPSLLDALLQHLTVIEGFARSVALDLERKGGAEAGEAYSRLRYLGSVPLLRDHVSKKLNRTPEDLFGRDAWEVFVLAIDYRNFVVHEAATIRGDHCAQLLSGCRQMLAKLANVADIVNAYQKLILSASSSVV